MFLVFFDVFLLFSCICLDLLYVFGCFWFDFIVLTL